MGQPGQARAHYCHNQYAAQSATATSPQRVWLLLRGLLDLLRQCEGTVETGQIARKGELIGQGIDIFVALKQGLAFPEESGKQPQSVRALSGQLDNLYDSCLFLLLRTTLDNDLEALRAVQHVVRTLISAWQEVSTHLESTTM